MRRPDFLLHRNAITHTAEMNWDATVAMAAPLTPMSSPKIRMGSRMMLLSAPMATVSMLVFAKPCAEIKGFNPRGSCTNRVPHR